MRRALRAGDTVIDGGSNIGLLSMVAAGRVGPTGRVYALEPNPAAFERLRWHIEANELSQIVALPIGLSDREEESEMRVPGTDNLGAGTFAPLPARYGGVTQQQVLARVARADALPNLEVRGELLVKLDVEGFELRAMRGTSALIQRHRPLVVCEVNEEMLRMAGATPADMFAFMAARGYRPFAFEARRAIVRLRRLALREIDPARGEIPFDAVWLHPQSAFWNRLDASRATTDRASTLAR